MAGNLLYTLPPHARTTLTAALLTAALLTGCDAAGTPGPTSAVQSPGSSAAEPSTPGTSTGAKAAEADYRDLLIGAEHLSDDEDTFTARSIAPVDSGVPGATAFFVNTEDNRAVANTVLVYQDETAAAAALEQATARLAEKIPDALLQPAAVGSNGVLASGTSPDASKSVTELLFTQGRTLVRMEFQRAVDDRAPDRYVTGVGKMQQIVIQTRMPDAE